MWPLLCYIEKQKHGKVKLWAVCIGKSWKPGNQKSVLLVSETWVNHLISLGFRFLFIRGRNLYWMTSGFFQVEISCFIIIHFQVSSTNTFFEIGNKKMAFSFRCMFYFPCLLLYSGINKQFNSQCVNSRGNREV